MKAASVGSDSYRLFRTNCVSSFGRFSGKSRSGLDRKSSGLAWTGSSSGNDAADMIGLAGAVSEATVWLMADMASGEGGFDCDVIDCDVIGCDDIGCGVIDVGGVFASSTNFEDGTGLGRAMPPTQN